MNDLEIARSVELENINKIIEKYGIDEKYIEQYGKYKAKIQNKLVENLNEKKMGV